MPRATLKIPPHLLRPLLRIEMRHARARRRHRRLGYIGTAIVAMLFIVGIVAGLAR